MGLQLSTRSVVPRGHGLTTFHPKQNLTETYMSNFLIVELLQEGWNRLSSRIRFTTRSCIWIYKFPREAIRNEE